MFLNVDLSVRILIRSAYSSRTVPILCKLFKCDEKLGFEEKNLPSSLNEHHREHFIFSLSTIMGHHFLMGRVLDCSSVFLSLFILCFPQIISRV